MKRCTGKNRLCSAVANQGFDSSGPIGALTPLVVGGTVGTAAGALDDEGARKIWLEVDGAKRQDSVLGEMVWSVPEMIARLSQVKGGRMCCLRNLKCQLVFSFRFLQSLLDGRTWRDDDLCTRELFDLGLAR